VLAVVLLLVARNWQSVAPTAIEVTSPELGAGVDDHGETGAAAELRSGQLPNLGEMRDSTNAHAEELQQALEAIE